MVTSYWSPSMHLHATVTRGTMTTCHLANTGPCAQLASWSNCPVAPQESSTTYRHQGASCDHGKLLVELLMKCFHNIRRWLLLGRAFFLLKCAY